jgi:hypothetical protein
MTESNRRDKRILEDWCEQRGHIDPTTGPHIPSVRLWDRDGTRKFAIHTFLNISIGVLCDMAHLTLQLSCDLTNFKQLFEWASADSRSQLPWRNELFFTGRIKEARKGILWSSIRIVSLLAAVVTVGPLG